MIIRYEKDPLTRDYGKKGELISGFLHDTAYNPRDKAGLLNPCEGMKPWGDSESIQIYQDGIEAGVVEMSESELLKVLPLTRPMRESESRINDILSEDPTHTITRKEMVVLINSTAYGEQMIKDFSTTSQNIRKRNDQFLENYFKGIENFLIRKNVFSQGDFLWTSFLE